MTEQPFRDADHGEDPEHPENPEHADRAEIPAELDPLDPRFGTDEEVGEDEDWQEETEDEQIARELAELEDEEPARAQDPLDAEFSVESIRAELRSRAPETQMAPRLDAMRMAMDFLGDPAHAAPVIHLTGTNGKTSTARVVEALLMAHDLRPGRYSSPHLERITERIAIDGEPVDDATFVRVWDEIRPFLALVDQRLEAAGQVPLTEFEAMTALAFAVFADEPVDVVVLEVGLGGEWDATNVADAQVSVVTPIDLDHTRMLGETVEEITREKAGIIKDEGFLVSAVQQPSVAEILLAAAREHGVPFRFEGVEFGVTERTPAVGGQVVSVQGLAGRYENLMLPLFGAHQAQNASVAIAAVEAFLGGGEKELNEELVRTGLEAVSSPGRLEVVRSAPVVVIDAAHNPHGIRASAAAFVENFEMRRLNLVLGILADKDAATMLDALREAYAESEQFETRLFVTASQSPRAIPAEDLRETALDAGFDEDAVEVHDSLADAVSAAVSDAAVDEELDATVLITGSVTVAGEARMLLGGQA